MELTRNRGIPSFKSFCDHCNNTTLQGIVAQELAQYNGDTKMFTLSICTICDGIAFRVHPMDSIGPLRTNTFAQEPDFQFEQLWPPPSTFSSKVPLRIRTIYEEACQVKKKSPSSFAVQIRRAFEALAKERKAGGHTLNDQVKWLIAQGQLPPVFAGMMNIARRIGNMGAHDAETDVTFEDVEIADQFFKAVIEYIYVAPALLDKVQNPEQSSGSSDESGSVEE